MVYHLITPLIASNKLNRAVRELRKGGVEILDESVAAPVFAPSAWEHQEGTSWGSLVSSHSCFDEKDNGCHAWRVIFYPNTEFYIWDIWCAQCCMHSGIEFLYLVKEKLQKYWVAPEIIRKANKAIVLFLAWQLIFGRRACIAFPRGNVIGRCPTVKGKGKQRERYHLRCQRPPFLPGLLDLYSWDTRSISSGSYECLR